jgi:uncharacterized membrane protein YcaP (DUF421 family)
MRQLFYQLFGLGKDLNALQVCVRTFLMFFIAILLLRLGGIRIFGKKSSFDEVVAVILGAILSRGIVGASPFGTVILSGAVLVLVHRFIAWACINNQTISTIINGRPVILYKDGKLLEHNLRKCSLSEKDLMESLRLHTSQDTLDGITAVYMETSGRISFIRPKTS